MRRRSSSRFLLPLSEAVGNAAALHGWNLVPAPQAFATHGYCAENTWIVLVSWSLLRQWSLAGTMHANLYGHEAQRKSVVAALERAGIDGKP